MLIYAVADLHGKDDRLHKIRQAIDAHRPDVLVLAGDITGHGNSPRFIQQIDSLPIQVLAIRGNSDGKRINTLIEGSAAIRSLHLNLLIIGGMPFVGLDGTLPVPFRSRICFRERDYLERIEPLITRDSVLVVHPPPWGFLDEVLGQFHAGSRGLASFISRVQPRLVICGHIHERRGATAMGDSLIVNCSMGRSGAGTLIQCNGHTIETLELY